MITSLLLILSFGFVRFIFSVIMERKHQQKAQAFQRTKIFSLIELHSLRLSHNLTGGLISSAVYFNS